CLVRAVPGAMRMGVVVPVQVADLAVVAVVALGLDLGVRRGIGTGGGGGEVGVGPVLVPVVATVGLAGGCLAVAEIPFGYQGDGGGGLRREVDVGWEC